MKTCTFDNPQTHARECWQDGKLTASYSARLLAPYARDPIPAHNFFFGANVGPWQPGQLVGDPGAIGAER